MSKKKEGNNFVKKYLDRKNYEILEENFKVADAIIPFIARKNGEIHFIDTKIRRAHAGFPEYTITNSKRAYYEGLMLTYVIKNRPASGRIGFDIISVIIIDDATASLRHHSDVLAEN